MTVSLLFKGLELIGLETDAFFEQLNAVSPELFMPIVELYREGEPKKAVLYILYAYSKDSPAVLLAQNWDYNKKMIAEKVQLPDHMYADLLMLKNDVICKVIKSYLDLQKDADWKHLMMNKDMYEGLFNSMYAAKSKSEEAEGGFDFDEIMKKRKLANELREEIIKMEVKFKEEYRFVNDNMKQLLNIVDEQKANGASLNIEENQYTKT